SAPFSPSGPARAPPRRRALRRSGILRRRPCTRCRPRRAASVPRGRPGTRISSRLHNESSVSFKTGLRVETTTYTAEHAELAETLPAVTYTAEHAEPAEKTLLDAASTTVSQA